MKNILLIIRNVFPMVLIVFLLASCVKDEPLGVNQFSIHFPNASPTISRTSLVPFSVGYANGNIQSRKATIQWTASTDPEFLCYKIFRNGALLITIANQTTTSYTDTTLVQNTYYLFTVATVTKQGASKTDTVTIKTPWFNPPGLNFQIKPGTPNNSVRIFWYRTNESATHYQLSKRGPLDPEYQIITTTTDTTYTDNNVLNYTTYYYRIAALNAFETTYVSYSYYAYVYYTMNTPYLYYAYQLTPSRQVYLNWYDYASGEDGYKIYRRRGFSGAYSLIGTVPTNSYEYYDRDTTALIPDSTYYYYVMGYNSDDTTSHSNVGYVTIFNPNKFKATWINQPPNSMASGIDYDVSWSTDTKTNYTNVQWYGSSWGSTPWQTGNAGTFSTKLRIYYPGYYYVFAMFYDTLGYPHSTDTIKVSVGGSYSGGTILNEGFESGSISYPWVNGGYAYWYASSVGPYSGYYSARSGNISNDQYTYISRTVSFTGYRTISFYYKVSSESCCDRLTFYIDGYSYGSWGGETGWQYFSTSYYGSGSVTLTWQYAKDGSVSTGSDAAWVDNIIVQ